MSLDTFTYCPPTDLERAIGYLAGLTRIDTATLRAKLDEAVAVATQQQQLVYLKNNRTVETAEEADTVQFSTGLTTTNGDEIVAKCFPNKRPGYQKWFGLIFQAQTKADNLEGFVLADLFFPNWLDGPRFLEALADMAIPETWSYKEYASKMKHPILRSYIGKTYERLKQQDKLVQEGDQVLFNTGLLDKWFKEIYVVCDISSEHGGRLINARPVLESDAIVLTRFRNRKPPLATFFTNITDVIFNPDMDISTDDTHIIEENWNRIPAEYQNLRQGQVFALFQAAVGFAKVMARRNYKLVIPQFFNGRIQFLMPIYLSGEFTGTPDCALALQAMNDDCYRGNTILTLDMAYQNARLIAKPDPTWLDPDTIHVGNNTRTV